MRFDAKPRSFPRDFDCRYFASLFSKDTNLGFVCCTKFIFQILLGALEADLLVFRYGPREFNYLANNRKTVSR